MVRVQLDDPQPPVALGEVSTTAIRQMHKPQLVERVPRLAVRVRHARVPITTTTVGAKRTISFSSPS